MSDNHIELKSVSDLLKMKFFIPNYQRGYRWKEKQVHQLLNDIDSFVPTEKNQFYFLQALAVADNQGQYNVVDGQQRLTTISLILENNENQEWISYDRLADQAIDKYYKDQARKVIEDFFPNEAAKAAFRTKITNNCKFLFYEVNPAKELNTFNELNSGKIPAKDSELVKCILLTKDADEPYSITQDRANEWDVIEREINNDAFFAWITPRNAWKEDDKMTVLFRYAGFCPNEETDEVFPFLTDIQRKIQDGTSRQTIWKQICSAYYRLIAWHKDSLMYHAFGAYVHRRGNKKIDKLDNNKIIEVVNAMADYKVDDNNNDYYEGGDKLHQYLLLANVAFCWKSTTSRYSFSHHRKVTSWSLEHIFAKRQGEITDDILKIWLPGISDEKLENFKQTEDKDKWLVTELKGQYPDEDDKWDNSLGNMALLPFSVNSALNNGMFGQKRDMIISWATNGWVDEYNKDRWIPPMTEAVFMKSIPETSMAIQFWSNKEKENYAKYMSDLVKNFVSQLS